MLSTNIATLTYVETRAVELRRQAAHSRLARQMRRSRPATGRTNSL